MNSIAGQISLIQSEGSFQLITVKAHNDSFRSIIIQSGYEEYHKGDQVLLHFKETEVSLATKKVQEISLQNQIAGTIKEIEKDALLTRVVLETQHGLLSSIITTASAERLDLQVGKKAVAMIKTNEVMLSKE